MHTTPRMKYGLLLAAALLTSCKSYSDLGAGFKLYEHDRDDVYVGYCFNDCDKSSIMVVPPTVTEVAYNDRWIVASAKNDSGEAGYWIVDKHVGTEFCYDCGFIDSLLSNVRGPLAAPEFASAMREDDIALSLNQ